MDLSSFELDELFLAAIKSELESNKLYKKMAKKTKNGLLEDKLKFLANEEEKHRLFIEDIYRNHYPENKIVIPKISPVPLPEICISVIALPLNSAPIFKESTFSSSKNKSSCFSR